VLSNDAFNFNSRRFIQVPGRLYPIKTHWLPPQPKDGKDGVPKDRPSNAELKEKAAKGGRGGACQMSLATSFNAFDSLPY